MKFFSTLLLIAFSFLSFSACAQNYQCLQSGVKHYFINSNGYLRGMRIDSVKTFGDSTVYYPYHTPRGYYTRYMPATLDSNGGSWLGKNVVKRSDGTFLFDNLWNDTVVIKTQANPGDTWTFYKDTTSLFYMADLVSADTMTVLGSVDSIKTILITAHNPSGIVTADPVDSFEIILSKNNGFAQVFDLYTFPYHAPDSAYMAGYDFYLDYHSIPIFAPLIPNRTNATFSLISIVNPTIAQLYQWSVGDIIEYSVCNDLFDHYGTGCDPAEYYSFDTIVSAGGSLGSMSYSVNGSVSKYIGPFPAYPTGPGSPAFYSTTENSGIATYSSALVFDTTAMPEEYNQRNIWGYFLDDNSYCTTNTLYAIQDNIEISGAEYVPPFEEIQDPSYYKSPVGLVSANRENPGVVGGNEVYSSKLIYYEHNGTPCGSLLIPPTSVKNITSPIKSIALYPNPAGSSLTISSPDKISTVAISDIPGQTIFTHNYNTEQVQIEVADLPTGMYLVKINGTEVRKFVKE